MPELETRRGDSTPKSKGGSPVKLLGDGADRCRLPKSAALLLAVSLSAGVACTTLPADTRGCICQSDDVLREIASGRAEFCTPALAAWEREWYRDCREVCDGK